jgi:integrase/recombinase XerD
MIAMACLFMRSNGIYYLAFFQRGRSKWKSLRTRSPEEAQEQFEEFQREWHKTHNNTTSGFFSRFLESAPLSYSVRTIRMYRLAFSNFTRIVRNKHLSLLVPLDAEEYKRVRSREVSPVSVNVELRTLKAALNVAVQWKLITENPFKNIRPVRVPYNEPRHLSKTEFAALLRVMGGSSLKDIVTFAVGTCMRLGEIINLRWENVDLEGRWIQVRSNGEFRVKGGRPRSVPMCEEVYRVLASKRGTSEYVFTDQKGRRLNPSTISHRFKKAVRRAGLPETIHFHSLRHTGISWLINKGVPPPFVQRIAGHSSLAVTQIYTHVEDRSLVEAINAFGPLMTN